MTVYDPIEVEMDCRAGYEYGNHVVVSPGTNEQRGYKFSGVKVYSDESDVGYLNVCISLNNQTTAFEPDLPVPNIFTDGNPNIIYRVTVQAIDLTEEE